MKNYYSILGISSSAKLSDIRDAYRSRAKRCHPDSSQSADTASQFRELHEAYSVLRDADLRRQYDRRLNASRGAPNRTHGGRTSGRRRRAAATSETTHALEELDLILSRAEARVGGSFALPLSEGHRCPACGGFGRLLFFACSFCRGTGVVNSQSVVFVAVPPGSATYDTIVGYDQKGVAIADIRIVVP